MQNNFKIFFTYLQLIARFFIKKDMYYVYNGKKIHYRFINGRSFCPIILLHGWGCDCTIFNNMVKYFPHKSFLTIDFPPFGKSDKNIEDWNIFTYVGMLMSLCQHLSIEKCDILGHSFGGRVAIILSAVKRSLVQSCILVDSAGMKPRFNIKVKAKVLKYKLYKKLGKNTENFGSRDYLALPQNMRKVFSSVVKTYLEEYARKMSVKTLIIWGENDKDTPIYMAKRLNKLIKDSKLSVINDSGHFSFIERPIEFYRLANEFWEG